MSKQYLDKTGLSYFWGKIKAYVDAHGGNVDSTPVPTASKVAEFDSYAHMNSTDMSAQEVSDFVDSLDASGVTVADYIVEQGTSGIWTYRKWNSGIAECWGVSALRTVSSWTQWGGIYYGNPYNVYDTYPSGLFTELPSCQTQIGQSSGDCYLVKGASGDATKTCAFYPSRGTSGGSFSYTVAYYAIGRWK